VNPVKMMRGAHRDAIVAGVVGAARAEEDAVIVEVAPRAARRHGAAPAVAGENGVMMAREVFPFTLHVRRPRGTYNSIEAVVNRRLAASVFLGSLVFMKT
jgi:hypothetical protein